MTYQGRVAVAVSVAVAVAVLLGAVGSYLAASRVLLDGLDRSLENQVPDRPLGPRALERLDGRGFPLGQIPGRLGGAGAFVQLVRADGTVVGAAGVTDRLPVDDRTLATARGGEAFFATVEVEDTSLRVYTEQVARNVAVQVARPIEEIEDALTRLRRTLFLVGSGGVLLAVVLGTGAARRLVAPVRDLTRTAETVAATQDLTHRIEVDGADELARLANSFNVMLANLDRARQAQRQLVADASHELRTPLTSLRTNIEVLLQGDELDSADRERLLRDVVVQLDEFGALVGGLVELARGDAPARAPTAVRLDELAEEVAERARIRNRDVPIEVRAEPTTVRGERDRLERAIANLLDNACSHGDGPVEVEVAAGEVSVRDHGPGVPEAERQRIFERFYRAPEARGRPGSGLGLAIVAQVAESHGGEVTVEAPDGGGTRFRLRLPTASDVG